MRWMARRNTRRLEKLVAIAFVAIAIASLIGNYINTNNQIQVNNILAVRHPEVNNIGILIKGAITALEDVILVIIAAILYFGIKPWGR
jgi:hypothetical protein